MVGPGELEKLRRVYEAGGSVSMAESEIRHSTDLPGQHFPATSISCADGVFTCTMVREAMEAFVDYDWDQALAKARLYDRAARIAELAVDFRGIVPIIELLRECVMELGDELDPFELLTILAERSRLGLAPYDFIPLEDEPYLVHHQVLFLEEDRLGSETVELDGVGVRLNQPSGVGP